MAGSEDGGAFNQDAKSPASKVNASIGIAGLPVTAEEIGSTLTDYLSTPPMRPAGSLR
jgi:hypothetical protein